MKNKYCPLFLQSINVISESPILTGSITSNEIKVNEVTVEDYKPGFGENPGVDDFKTISFD